jgi:hypothetical protein
VEFALMPSEGLKNHPAPYYGAESTKGKDQSCCSPSVFTERISEKHRSKTDNPKTDLNLFCRMTVYSALLHVAVKRKKYIYLYI